MLRVLFTRFHSPFSSDILGRYFQGLPKIIRTKLRLYRRWQDQQRGLLGKLLLREALIGFGYATDCLEKIVDDQYGRPFFTSAIDFNISHSGSLIVCTITDIGKVGIDVEEIKPINLEHFKEYITDHELKNIFVQEESIKIFYSIWTQKESVLKADGRGLSIPINDVKLDSSVAELYGKRWYVKPLDLDDNYQCCLSTSIQHPETTISEFHF